MFERGLPTSRTLSKKSVKVPAEPVKLVSETSNEDRDEWMEEWRRMSREVMEFVIYMIHACARRWGQSPAKVYQRLSKQDCISNYLVPHYDILHTQSTDYVVDDIEEYIGEKGSSV